MDVTDLRARLSLNYSQFIAGMNQASRAADRFSARMVNNISNNVTTPFESASRSVRDFSLVSASGLRDVSRIVQGILISQFFYRTINLAQEAGAAVFDMSKQFENANTAFTIMFGSEGKAQAYLRTIEDFAAITPYSFNEATEAAKRLLAMGIKAENSLYILRNITDAATMSGDPQSLNRISKAIGQINTKGKLAQQEMLQLTEAGIPAFDILQKKLKLTRDQLGRIGDLAIPADVAIKALVEGMGERYGGASDAMSKNVGGLLSTIKDNLLLMSKDMFAPLYQDAKDTFTKIANETTKLRDLIKSGGFGALFEKLVPKGAQDFLRNFVAYHKVLWVQFGAQLKAVIPIVIQFASMFSNIFSIIAPVVLTVNQALLYLLQTVANATPLVKVLVTAIGALLITASVTSAVVGLTAALKGMFIVKALTAAVVGLASAFRVLTIAMLTNPIALAVGALTAGVVALAYNSAKFKKTLNGIGTSIGKTFGMDPSKVFVPKTKENTDASAAFNKELTTTGKSIDKVGDKAKKAGDKAKSALMSFDEVFTINDPDGSDANADKALDDIEVPDIPIPEFNAEGLNTDSMKDITQRIVDIFKTSLLDRFKDAFNGALIGGAIGAGIGGLLGGPGGALIGGKIGVLAGGIVGLFWENLSSRFKDAAKAALVGSSIGFALGAILGGPGGAAIGAALGGLVSGIVKYFWEDLQAYFTKSTSIGALTGTAIGGILGFAFGGPLGIGIGAALGGILGSVVGHFWEDISKFFTDSTAKGALTGTAIGGAVGLLFGGPFGLAIGAALGGVAGTIVGHFWEDLKKFFKTDAGAGATIGGSVGLLLGGPLGAAAGAVVGGILGSKWKEITEWWDTVKEGFKSWSSDVETSIDTWADNVKTSFVGWSTETISTIESWCVDTKEKFSLWFMDVTVDFIKWWKDIEQGFTGWSAVVLETITKWCTDAFDKISAWGADTITELTTWWISTRDSFTDWEQAVIKTIHNWIDDSSKGITKWSQNTKQGFATWSSSVGTEFSKWKEVIIQYINKWYTDTASKLQGWSKEHILLFTNWKASITQVFTNWKDDIEGTLSTWYTNTHTKISGWTSVIKGVFTDWWKTTRTGFSEWASGIYTDVVGWFDSLASKISGFMSKLAFWKKDAQDSADAAIAAQAAAAAAQAGANSSKTSLAGHARGGIFNKEHIANFAEGNKAEAIIPLENDTAMAPFVNAVANGITSALAPLVTSSSSNMQSNTMDDRPILYVGTLIADDRSLKELDRKMRVISIQEDQRRGLK